MKERYKIIQEIGRGGRGVVYQAMDTTLGREVAIKRILIDAGLPLEQLAESLTREARALSTLRHPNIVTVHDMGFDDNSPFIVMELLKGETLEKIIRRNTLPLEDFGKLATQVLEGMIAAQAAGLLHLDLKPANIMLDWLPSGKFQVKILDFGLAQFALNPFTQTLDEDDSISGSVFFMAPEQFELAPIDARTDLYALGAIFYFTLAGNYPFVGESASQVISAHLSHRVVPIPMIRPDVPETVWRWIDSLIARNPDDRPASAREALDAFSMERVIDERQFRDASSNDPKIAAQLLEEYRQESAVLITTLEKELSEQRGSDARETARTLRGAASTLGYLEIFSLAGEIEKNALSNPARCLEIGRKFPAAVERITRAVHAFRWKKLSQ